MYFMVICFFVALREYWLHGAAGYRPAWEQSSSVYHTYAVADPPDSIVQWPCWYGCEPSVRWDNLSNNVIVNPKRNSKSPKILSRFFKHILCKQGICMHKRKNACRGRAPIPVSEQNSAVPSLQYFSFYANITVVKKQEQPDGHFSHLPLSQPRNQGSHGHWHGTCQEMQRRLAAGYRPRLWPRGHRGAE